MNYNNLCICFQPAIKIDAFCFQFLILDWRNCWQGCWTEKDYLTDELNFLKSLEPEIQQPTPAKNGHQYPTKSKSSQSSTHVGHAQKATSTRSGSVDKTKASTREASADRNGRVASPAMVNSVHDASNQPPSYSQHRERESSTERTISSSDSREDRDTRSTLKQPPPAVNIEPSKDEDDTPTPTQSKRYSRGLTDSTTQFRLDLSNPPSSPFNIKF